MFSFWRGFRHRFDSDEEEEARTTGEVDFWLLSSVFCAFYAIFYRSGLRDVAKQVLTISRVGEHLGKLSSRGMLIQISGPSQNAKGCHCHKKTF
jgi:hypothetical protein